MKYCVCPACEQPVDATAYTPGESIMCPNCRGSFQVPEPGSPRWVQPRMLPCPSCSTHVDVTAFWPGAKVLCPVCQQQFVLPGDPPPAPPSTRVIDCPHCREHLDVSTARPGSEIDCPNCGDRVWIPPNVPAIAGASAQPSALATIALIETILAAVFFLPLAAMSLAIGLVAYWRIKRRPDRLEGGGQAVISVWGSAVLLLIYLLFMPGFFTAPMGTAPLDDLPGMPVASTEKPSAHVEDTKIRDDGSGGTVVTGSYTRKLDDLIPYNKTLAETPGVTFLFGPISPDGYTFTTMHPRGSRDENGPKGFVFRGGAKR
ncbi:hypothetical protein KDL45_10520 [bacterium]|nr:hypothetical protein [bacterium]